MARLYSIFAIEKRESDRFRTRVIGIAGKSQYQNIFIDTPTPLVNTGTKPAFSFSMNDTSDIFAIQMSGFDPDPNLDRTSLYILDSKQSWSQFLTKNNPTPTSLPQTDNNWEFGMRGSDLFAFNKTDLRHHGIFDVPVFVLLSLFNYQNPYNNQNGLEFGIPVPLKGPEERLSALSFGMSYNDIVIIKKRYTSNGTVEVYILDQDKNYREYKHWYGTHLPEIPPAEDSDWKFLIAPAGLEGLLSDLVVIHKRNTASKMTEVQVLSGKSGYHEFALPEVKTPLPETGDSVDFVMQTDQDWEPQGMPRSPPDPAP
jgi:hypothetical protein